MFIETLWQDSVLALLVAINGLCGAPERDLPLRTLTSADVITIAQSLMAGGYRPEQWFTVSGGTPARPLPEAAPPVSAAATYTLVWLGIEPSDREGLSGNSGGMLYEDPFYALLAAYNLRLKGAPLVDPSVSSRDQAWSQRRQIVDALRQRQYRPQAYFAPGGAVLYAPGADPLRVTTAPGAALEKLVRNGSTDVVLDGQANQLYGVYRYVAP